MVCWVVVMVAYGLLFGGCDLVVVLAVDDLCDWCWWLLLLIGLVVGTSGVCGGCFAGEVCGLFLLHLLLSCCLRRLL